MADQAKISGQGGAAADDTTDDNQQKMKFIDFLKSEVFPTLPKKKLEALVEELEEPHGIYSAADLSRMTMAALQKLKSIRGVQWDRLREYVEGQQDALLPQPPQLPTRQAKNVATFMKSAHGKGGSATIKGGTVTVAAVGRSAAGKEDGSTNEANFMVGPGNVELLDNVKTKIVAGETTDGQRTMEFIVQLENEVFPGLDHQMVVDLVHELQDPYGVNCESDLVDVNLEEMKLTSIKGEQLKQFRKYVQGVQGQQKP